MSSKKIATSSVACDYKSEVSHLVRSQPSAVMSSEICFANFFVIGKEERRMRGKRMQAFLLEEESILLERR